MTKLDNSLKRHQSQVHRNSNFEFFETKFFFISKKKKKKDKKK